MNNFEDRFNAYIKANPRQSLKMLLFAVCFVWVTPVCVFGLILYLLLSKVARVQWWLSLTAGSCLALIIVMIDLKYSARGINLAAFMKEGFTWNYGFWKLMITCSGPCAIKFMLKYMMSYVAEFSLIFAGILSAVDLIEDNPHRLMIDALQKGEHINVRKELSEKKINAALRKLNDADADGTILGVSTYTGSPVIIPDRFINQIVMVLGTTGAGKTVTLRRFYRRAIAKGYPLIVVDGKPTDDNVAWLQDLSEKQGRVFYGFNCANYSHYDPLANGGYTELKDKLISLKDQWENDYYRSIAEDYLQTTFEVLLLCKKPFDLKRVVKCLDLENLQALARETGVEEMTNRVESLAKYEREDITGLQAHLNLLINSELGHYFTQNENTFTLPQVINENAVVYFALPALRFPSFSKVLGKLVINDLKAAIDLSNPDNRRVFMIFDEFSVFAGEQVLNLVNMGRGKGVHAIFGTQGLADLDRVDKGFKSQVMNCANTIICHRLNDQESAESISNWVGTEDKFSVSAQYNPNQTDAGVGTIGHAKEFIVHPDQIKQGLRTGEAFCVSKVGQFGWEKVRVVCH
jgi:hypothetical protein